MYIAKFSSKINGGGGGGGGGGEGVGMVLNLCTDKCLVPPPTPTVFLRLFNRSFTFLTVLEVVNSFSH